MKLYLTSGNLEYQVKKEIKAQVTFVADNPEMVSGLLEVASSGESAPRSRLFWGSETTEP